MINYTWSWLSPPISQDNSHNHRSYTGKKSKSSSLINGQHWLMFGSGGFLVSIPVFIQAPLVRSLPLLSLMITFVWIMIGFHLWKNSKTQIWGDLIIGFSWSWLAGSIYWGWFRDEPLIHLPIEAIGVPFVLICMLCRWGMIGNLFYLGSLMGTVITDIYFYLTGLIPYWRALIKAPPDMIQPILKNALNHIHNTWGILWMLLLVSILLIVGLFSLRQKDLYWWAFSGAVLCTLLVDGLFFIASNLA